MSNKDKVISKEEELLANPVRSKEEALKILKNIFPKGEYVWYCTYLENTGCRGTQRDILPSSDGDYNAPCHVKEHFLDTWMYPEWANITVSKHWKLISLSEWKKIPKDKGPHLPVIVKI